MFVHINIASNYQPFKETTKAKYVMAIFGLLLKSIFLVALLVAVFIIGVMVYMYMRVKQMARHFTAQGKAANGASAGRHTTSAGNGSTWSNSSSTNNSRTTGGSELQLTVRKHPTSMKNSTTSAPHNRQTARYSARTRATM